MIAKLKGIVDTTKNNQVILDVNGVGYNLLCSRYTLSLLPSAGNMTVLFVEVLIRQDNITLFGFATEEEQEAFRLLLTVQGVGGKVCLSLLSAIAPATLQSCLITQDHAPLTQAEGVGPKLALRIVRELKGKTILGTTPSINFSSAATTISSETSSSAIEAISALVNLGYRKNEVTEAVTRAQKALEDTNTSLDKLIPQALQYLSKING